MVDDFGGAVADVVHPAHPFHLVICFELFGDALAGFHLSYQLRKHFFCLGVDFGEVVIESAVDRQLGVQEFLVFADVGEIAFAPYTDVCFEEFEAGYVIITVAFIPQAVAFVVDILFHRYDDEIITVNTADAFIAAFANLEQDQIITLTGDIDMTGKNWTPVENKGFTLNGNGNTVTGLNGPLVATTATQNYTIKNITFDGLRVNTTDNYAALIAYADTCAYIMMDNVTIKNADIQSAKYAAGFAAYTSGYGADWDGPVYASHNFINCKLENSTITGNGSTGGLIGHAGGNKATTTTVTDFTQSGNTIQGEDREHTGNIIGTAGCGIAYLNGTGVTADDLGRFVPATTGKLYINGVEQDAFANQ